MDRPRPLIALFLAIEGGLYAAFLTIDILGGETAALKYAAILLCAGFALLSACRGGDRLTALALALTICADWFLLVREERYALGVGIFLAVQTVYLLRLRRAGAGPALPFRMGAALVLEAGLYLLRLVSPLNLLSALYFSQLLSNAALAWTLPGRRWRLFALGLTLFMGCDLCVGASNTPALVPTAIRPLVRVGMWAFYLPSQVLIVLSALPGKESAHENQ